MNCNDFYAFMHVMLQCDAAMCSRMIIFPWNKSSTTYSHNTYRMDGCFVCVWGGVIHDTKWVHFRSSKLIIIIIVVLCCVVVVVSIIILCSKKQGS